MLGKNLFQSKIRLGTTWNRVGTGSGNFPDFAYAMPLHALARAHLWNWYVALGAKKARRAFRLTGLKVGGLSPPFLLGFVAFVRLAFGFGLIGGVLVKYRDHCVDRLIHYFVGVSRHVAPFVTRMVG